MDLQRVVKYQSELDPNFLHELEQSIGCEGIRSCIQCGECSGICPLSIYMDIPPRKIVAMVREGFSEEVLRSFTIWLCASCYACSVQCPQQIRITDIMYALKRKAIEQKKFPSKFPIPILSSEFFKMILKYGRNSEFQLVIKTWIKISIAKLLTMAPMGIDLLKTGRFSLRTHSVKNRNDIKVILNHMKS